MRRRPRGRAPGSGWTRPRGASGSRGRPSARDGRARTGAPAAATGRRRAARGPRPDASGSRRAPRRRACRASSSTSWRTLTLPTSWSAAPSRSASSSSSSSRVSPPRPRRSSRHARRARRARGRRPPSRLKRRRVEPRAVWFPPRAQNPSRRFSPRCESASRGSRARRAPGRSRPRDGREARCERVRDGRRARRGCPRRVPGRAVLRRGAQLADPRCPRRAPGPSPRRDRRRGRARPSTRHGARRLPPAADRHRRDLAVARARRGRVRNGVDPADHARAVDGRAVVAGDRRRVQGACCSRRTAARSCSR